MIIKPTSTLLERVYGWHNDKDSKHFSILKYYLSFEKNLFFKNTFQT